MGRSGSFWYEWLDVVLERLLGAWREDGDTLIILTNGNLTPQMPLLIIQILQLQMQFINLLSCIRSLLFRLPRIQYGFPIQPTYDGEMRIEDFLLGGKVIFIA
jgi:hypothetical protein